VSAQWPIFFLFFQMLRSITMQPERWAKRLIARAIPFMTLGNPIYSGKSSRTRSRTMARKNIRDCIIVNSFPKPLNTFDDYRMDWEEEIVTRNYVLSDFVTKTTYFSLAAAAFVFVSMLMMTGLHP
jgi:hypothetical protein